MVDVWYTGDPDAERVFNSRVTCFIGPALLNR